MNSIHVMRDTPVVNRDGRTATITGRSNEIFRLLVLNQGKTVQKTKIANLRETADYTAASKIRDLRNKLANAECEHIVELDRGTGYGLKLDGEWFVDAWEFQSVVEALEGGIEIDATPHIDTVTARAEVNKIVRTLNLWEANPGTGLSHWPEKYERLKRRADDRLLRARLCTREPDQIREAIQELEHRSRLGTADECVWRYLLLAYEALASSGQVDATWDRILQYYKSTPPDTLLNAMTAIRRGDPNPFRASSYAPPAPHHAVSHPQGGRINDDGSLEELCNILGITVASRLRLEGSQLTPLQCIRRTRTRLYFMGVLASKWVIDPAVRSEFKQLLTRLDAMEGDVRFLIIDPSGDGFRRLHELRKGNVSDESLTPLTKLVSEHKCFQVRMYSNLPAFRIIVIDDDVVSFSAYRLAAAAYLATDRGWESPHVVLDPLAKYPLAEAFQLLFLETWDNSKPLQGSK